MARTVTGYLNLMRHGLGKTPDSRHSLIDDFNDAGRTLFQAAQGPPHFHTWTWITRDNVPFSLPGGNVEEVQLPADFGELVSLQFRDSYVGNFVFTTPQDLNLVRRAFDIDPLRVHITFGVGSKQPSKDAPPRKVAAFWPPRADELTGLILSYRRVWADMSAADGNAIPDIPAEWERLLVLLSRSFAVHIEDQAAAFEEEPIVRELERLVAFGAGRQVDHGKSRHSVMQRATGGLGVVSWYGRRIVRP